jgi:hypothetical protein
MNNLHFELNLDNAQQNMQVDSLQVMTAKMILLQNHDDRKN